MSYVLGIDIGTSFTAAAIARCGEGASHSPQVLNLDGRGGTVPSVFFSAEGGQFFVGETAERRGLVSPDRMVREFKRRVGDSVPIVVGDTCFAPENIFAIMVRWVVDRAEEREGELAQVVAVSHPVSWGEYKTTLIQEALVNVGLLNVVLMSEPEAAALHYASQERVDADSTIAVYDLGGGTFDAAVLRKSSGKAFHSLGRPEGMERLGGADFDEAVFRHVVANTGAALTNLDPTRPGVLLALSRLRRECVEAKEALSSDSEETIPVFLPDVQTQVRLVRSEFEGMISESIRETIDVLRHAMQIAEVKSEDLDVILLVGGSSRIPLIAQMLSEELDRPLAIDTDPKASISLGAAFAASALTEERVEAAKAAEEKAQDNSGVIMSPLRPNTHRPEAATAELIPFSGHAAPTRRRGRARAIAIMAVVAAFTVLSAAAAQSPAGLSALNSVLSPQNAVGDEDDRGLNNKGADKGTLPAEDVQTSKQASVEEPTQSWFTEAMSQTKEPDGEVKTAIGMDNSSDETKDPVPGATSSPIRGSNGQDQSSAPSKGPASGASSPTLKATPKIPSSTAVPIRPIPGMPSAGSTTESVPGSTIPAPNPSPVPSSTPTSEPTPEEPLVTPGPGVPSVDPTPTPTVTADPTPTPTVTADPTPTPTVTADPTPTPTVTADATVTADPTVTATSDPTESVSPPER